MPKWNGYYTPLAEKVSGFEYAEFSYTNFYEPDPDNPVIFQLRKKGIGEPMIARSGMYAVEADGQPRYINLKTGRTSRTNSENCDLIITLTRDGDNPQTSAWSFIVKVPDGGLIPSNEEFLVQAPETGYQSQMDFNSTKIQTNTEHKFYIQSGKSTSAFIPSPTPVIARAMFGSDIGSTPLVLATWNLIQTSRSSRSSPRSN